MAHLCASEVIEVDVRAHRVVRTITGLSQVHGVLVVPALHRLFATATGDDQMAAVEEDRVGEPDAEESHGVALAADCAGAVVLGLE